ncbi:fungal-specific transcription factor [Lasiosphaeria hispida]|uniref:Fungal-specific transcription factor n=1 Tax=Lasiosphaeria hispida TaxID=260671 RepID=A0AAJ0HKG7_9PEZI|nr:fungal-specific transcription factor [Lasiosphaeria hispida]
MFEPSALDLQQARSQQACVACRNQKRKCDKLLPKCSLCTRTGRACEYASVTPRAPANLEALQTRLSELEDRLGSRTASVAAYHSGNASPAVPVSSMSHSVGSGGAEPGSVRPDSPQAAGQAATTARVPSLLFLDVDRFQDSQLRLLTPTVRIPSDVLAVLSFENTVVDAAAVYFDTIHHWMPFISRKRMDLGIPLRSGGPDLAMLFLAMKLITSSPSPAGPATPPGHDPLYTMAKAFLSLFEANGEVSLLCLQAMVLIALYEYGHAVYPAAWMTVGACTRYADMLRITLGEERSSVMDKVTTWTELEERRRLCWAIFVLDKAIALGNRSRVAAAEPPETAALPADDLAWSEGDALHGMAYPVSASYDLPQGPFARLCQAAMLASRAIATRRRIKLMPQQPGADRVSETSALADDILRFDAILSTATADETSSAAGCAGAYYQTLAPRFLAWSAFFVLLDPYCCPVNIAPGDPGHGAVPEAKTAEEMALQRRSTEIIVTVVAKVHEVVRSISNGMSEEAEQEAAQRRLGKFCPLGLDAVYCIMGLYCWLCQEGGDETVKDRLADVDRFFSGVGERWRLAREYLHLKKYHDDAGQLGVGG